MADVLHRATKQHLLSVNTPDFDPGVWIINPDLTGLFNRPTRIYLVPLKYWKIEGDAVSEMSQAEKDAVDAALTSTQVGDKNVLIRTITGGRVVKETWYDQDNGDGTYTGPVEETIYTYEKSYLKSKEIRQLALDGTVLESEAWDYFTGSGREEILKKRNA